MSERGSFVTQYIHCDKCLAVAFEILGTNDKFLKGVMIPSWREGENLPIIAGKIGGTFIGEELITMDSELGFELSQRLCHPLRVAVHADSGDSQIFVFEPEGNHVQRG